jgi:DNA polymerase-3 subunit alpha
MRLGRDFVLDGELVDRIAEIEGVANVQLKAERGPSLRLVA